MNLELLDLSPVLFLLHYKTFSLLKKINSWILFMILSFYSVAIYDHLKSIHQAFLCNFVNF